LETSDGQRPTSKFIRVLDANISPHLDVGSDDETAQERQTCHRLVQNLVADSASTSPRPPPYPDSDVEVVAPNDVVDLTDDGPSSRSGSTSDGEQESIVLRPRAADFAAGKVNAVASTPIEGPTSFLYLTCPICLGPPNPLVATQCGHTFCGPCLFASLSQEGPAGARRETVVEKGKCPLCRAELSSGWGKSLRGLSYKYRSVESSEQGVNLA